MKFTNAIAYCKNWYEHSGDVDTMWRDFAHCIYNDGWHAFTRRDVAAWCLHRMDDFMLEHPDKAFLVSPSKVFSAIARNKSIHSVCKRKPERELDEFDHVIWAFRDIFAYMDGCLFEGGVVPSAEVLPLNENVSESMWEKCRAECSEQKADADWARVEEMIDYMN